MKRRREKHGRDVSVACLVNWGGEGKNNELARNRAFVTHFGYICAEPRPRKDALPKRLSDSSDCRIHIRHRFAHFQSFSKSLNMTVWCNSPMGPRPCFALTSHNTTTRGAAKPISSQFEKSCNVQRTNNRREEERQSNNDQSC